MITRGKSTVDDASETIPVRAVAREKRTIA
jgi:hypothetical protein